MIEFTKDELEQDVSPYCEPRLPNSNECLSRRYHLFVRGKCFDCGIEKEDCQHEFTDDKYWLNHPDDARRVCIKCGEFYR